MAIGGIDISERNLEWGLTYTTTTVRCARARRARARCGFCGAQRRAQHGARARARELRPRASARVGADGQTAALRRPGRAPRACGRPPTCAHLPLPLPQAHTRAPLRPPVSCARSGYRILVSADSYHISYFVFLDAFDASLWIAILLTCGERRAG